MVGAGGAGFPTHVKLQAKADYYLVNGVECEPLLHKDKELMRLQAGRLVEGLRLAMEATAATQGIIAIKSKAKDAIAKAWDVGIEPYTSFLLGGDQDDLGTVDRMLKFADDAKIRKAEFAIATPYPGTPQWHQLVKEDRILTRDWSKYNDANPVFQPAQMTPDQLNDGYERLWKDFYAGRQHLADLSTPERTIQF